MKNDWLDRAKKRLKSEASEPSDAPFERLKAQGMIDDQGEVTGQLHRWNAFLAITEVKRAANGPRLAVFRCLKPGFGMPGGATIDISRDSMVTYLKEGKWVITAHHDNRLNIWKEGCDVHLSTDGFILCESAGEGKDDVGTLPEFQQSDSRL